MSQVTSSTKLASIITSIISFVIGICFINGIICFDKLIKLPPIKKRHPKSVIFICSCTICALCITNPFALISLHNINENGVIIKILSMIFGHLTSSLAYAASAYRVYFMWFDIR